MEAEEDKKIVLGKPLVLLMAVGAGMTVANLYYAQPLLEELSRFFLVSHSTIGMAAMLEWFRAASRRPRPAHSSSIPVTPSE